jgi:isocitrate dehydrogenase (NAD+)
MGKRRVILLPGDGIGPEVIEVGRRVVDAATDIVQWLPMEVGQSAFDKHGDFLPLHVVEEIRRTGVALKGPTATLVGGGRIPANVRFRKELDLFANVRPVRTLPGLETTFGTVDLTIIRENTEPFHAGLENEVAPGVITSTRVITDRASRRIANFAFKYAVEWRRRRITAVHRANIMRKANGLFVACARKEAREFAEKVEFGDILVEDFAAGLIENASQFDVLLLENLYGDIVGDLTAGLTGGQGLAPGASFGDDCAVFEAIHGTAPAVADKGVANPIGVVLSGAMMCHHLGDTNACSIIYESVCAVVQGQRELLTPDVGGKGTTEGVTKAIIAEVKRHRSKPSKDQP